MNEKKIAKLSCQGLKLNRAKIYYHFANYIGY